MKTIGFVDYFIDEWHSNNYIGWIEELCAQNGLDYKVRYAWAELEDPASEFPGKMTTAEWCAKNGVERTDSIEELCEKSDYIMILAPANPEKHLEYARKVFPFGKTTYIDKTFTTDADTAGKIYALAEQYHVRFFSTSALRYATEMDEARGKGSEMTVTGGGRSFEEYCIHQIEMVVCTMGIGAKELYVFGGGAQRTVLVKYADGRYATMNYAPSMDFWVTIRCGGQEDTSTAVDSDYFRFLLSDIMKFFRTGEVPFPPEQTMEVMAIRDAAIRGLSETDRWIRIGG